MTNQLIKNTKLTYTPGTPGVAYSPGRPYIRDYYSLEAQTVCQHVVTGGSWQWVLVTNPDGSQGYQYMLVPDPGSNNNVATSGYQCTTQMVPVYHPEQEYIAPTPGVAPTPAQITYDFNLGWNSGARSQGFFVGDGYTSFKASPTIVGVVAGLNYTDPDAGYTNIDHGFYISNGIVRLMELGSTVAYIGPQVADDVYKVSRRKGVVTYLINDVVQYTSSTPSVGVTFLDVSFYSGGDYLDSPAISGYGSADMALEAMTVYAGAANHGAATLVMEPMVMAATSGATLQGAGLLLQPLRITGGNNGAGLIGSMTSANLFMAPMTMSSNPFQGGTLNMLPMTGRASDYVISEAAMSFEPMAVESISGELVPSYALANLPMVQMTMTANSVVGEVGQISMVMEKPIMLAGRAGYGQATLRMVAPAMYASAFEGNANASMRELIISRQSMTYIGYVDVQLFSSASAADSMFTLVLKDAAAQSTATASDTLSYSAVLQALMQVELQMFAGIPILTESGEVWVVNDESGASSQYENYGFNSFAQYQGKYLGAKADGVYLLEGAADVAAPVRSSISLGTKDFGTTLSKTVTNCYVGVSSTGDVYLRVTANGTSYTYKTVANTSYLDTQRIQIGRGLRANYITFELFNEAGAEFELASVEFQAATLNRRI